MLSLRPVRAEDETTLQKFHDEVLREDGYPFLPDSGSWKKRENRNSSQEAREDFLVAVVDDVPVGRVSIRYKLTDELFHVGGHVGYAVAPRYRGRGYAREILRQSVTKLRSRGVTKILLTCNATNTRSARVIEACGGVLEKETTYQGIAKKRYWIQVKNSRESLL